MGLKIPENIAAIAASLGISIDPKYPSLALEALASQSQTEDANTLRAFLKDAVAKLRSLQAGGVPSADVEAGEIWRTGEGAVPEKKRSALTRFRDLFNRRVQPESGDKEALNLIWLASRGKPLSSDEALEVISFLEVVPDRYPSVVSQDIHLRDEALKIFWDVMNWAKPQHALRLFYDYMNTAPLGGASSLRTLRAGNRWNPSGVRNLLHPYLSHHNPLSLYELSWLLNQLRTAARFYKDIGNEEGIKPALLAADAVVFLIGKKGMTNKDGGLGDGTALVDPVDPGRPRRRTVGEGRKRRSGGFNNGFIPFIFAHGLNGEVPIGDRELLIVDRGSWIACPERSRRVDREEDVVTTDDGRLPAEARRAKEGWTPAPARPAGGRRSSESEGGTDEAVESAKVAEANSGLLPQTGSLWEAGLGNPLWGAGAAAFAGTPAANLAVNFLVCR